MSEEFDSSRLRRNVRVSNREEQETRSAGNRGRWISAQWRFDELPVRVHFQWPGKKFVDRMTGDEAPWVHGTRHFVAGAGAKGNGQFLRHGDRCVTCAKMMPGEYQLKIEPDLGLGRRVKTSTFVGTSGWVEEWFHLVKEAARDGRTDEKTGQPVVYTNKQLCTGRSCQHCTANIPKVFGKKSLFEFSGSAWDTAIEPLMEWAERRCRCSGYIYPSHYECEKCKKSVIDVTNSCPKCGPDSPVAVDATTDRAECETCHSQWELLEANDPQMKKLASTKTRCGHCGEQGYPAIVLVCTTEGCKARPHSIFDIQFRVKKVGSGKGSELQCTEPRLQKPDARLFEAQHQGSGEVAVEAAKRNNEPFDLDRAYAADPPGYQAQQLKCKNPFQAADGPSAVHEDDQQSVPYDG